MTAQGQRGAMMSVSLDGIGDGERVGSYLVNKHFGGLLYEALGGMGMKKKRLERRKLEVKKGQVSKEKVEGGASRPLRWFVVVAVVGGQKKNKK